MNEAIFRREVYQMLRYRYGLWPQHIPDVVGSKRPGVPDLIVMNPKGPGFYVEVKYIDIEKDSSFAFSKIEESQRQWLSLWEAERHFGSYLAIGTKNQRQRDLYFIWWPHWIEVERGIISHQASLPYHAGKGFSVELQELGYDFSVIETEKCTKDMGWVLPNHIIYDMRLNSE